ncbi:hypothetical protein H8E77_26560 [bacterium]|nr:hypothetical protein [bacterium]
MSKQYCGALLGLTVLTLIISIPCQAQERPIQLSLVTPIQLFPEDNSIKGVRINLIYGRNVSITGLDWGLVNHTTTGKSTGIQIGFVGLSDSDFMGLQYNALNVTKGNVEGLQWGVLNYAHAMNGLQLGLVNYAQMMDGLQIGLVNIIRQGGTFPVFPIVNWSF